MKKFYTLFLAVLTAGTVAAKGMEISAGLVGGLGLGVQGKFMFTENLGLMDELGYFMNLDGGTSNKYGFSSYAGLINNTTFVYQMPITEAQGMSLDWYAGGQAKIGWMPMQAGVFGLGAAGGIELKMKSAPIAVSFDFRPGWAMVFAGNEEGDLGIACHMFDYSFNLGVRYIIMGKK